MNVQVRRDGRLRSFLYPGSVSSPNLSARTCALSLSDTMPLASLRSMGWQRSATGRSFGVANSRRFAFLPRTQEPPRFPQNVRGLTIWRLASSECLR